MADGLVLLYFSPHQPSVGPDGAGNVRSPDARAEVAAQFIRSIRAGLGEAVLDRLIDARSAESKAACAAAREGRPT